MEKCYFTQKVQPIQRSQRALVLLAMTLILFVGTGFWNGQAQAQCAWVETGDITGNVPYGSSINWANPNRVEISDDLYARTSLNAGDTTKYLMVRDFGYLLPPSATILGIEVHAEVKMETEFTDARDASVRLMKAGTAVGLDYANPLSLWEYKDNVNLYGGSTDMWGETWTPADINSPDFGLLFSVTRLSGPNQEFVYVDYVTLTVYYTDPSCILPVTMTTFKATASSNGTVVLDWTTASESNNSHFEIMRSSNGMDFNTVGKVEGNGTTSQMIDYSFEDLTATTGMNYYQLKQVDFNGQSTLSSVAVATIDEANALTVTSHPNPASDLLSISIQAANGDAEVKLIDTQGRIVKEVETADTHSEIDIQDLKSGIYILRVESGRQSSNQRIVKL